MDFGCNIGRFTNLLKQELPECKIYGADISPSAIRYARKTREDIGFFVIDDEFFNKRRFDVVVISHVLEHIQDSVGALRNISALLSKGGKLIIAVPYERIRGDTTFFQILLSALQLRFENPHKVKLDYSSLDACLRQAGFRIVDHTYINFFRPSRSEKRRFNTYSLVVVAEKIKDSARG